MVGMTDLKSNFVNAESHLKNVTISNNGPELLITDMQQNVEKNLVQEGCSGDVRQYVVKAPRPDSKLILQNMEEVLNSVKKKHRQKHRRKREQKKLAQMEAAAVAAGLLKTELDQGKSVDILETKKSFTCCVSKSKDGSHLNGKQRKTQPLREKTAQENGQEGGRRNGRKNKTLDNKSPLKNSTPNGDILRHFQRTPKKNFDFSPTEHVEQNTKPHSSSRVDAINQSASKNLLKPMNAFEVMMNARNKSIGSNTLGKEISPTNSQESTVNSKRKAMLQEWADRKGGIKRKLEEETRAAYVEHQLENRAKRFKQLLVHPVSSSSNQDYELTSPSPSEKQRRHNKASDVTKPKRDKSKIKKKPAARLESIDTDSDSGEVVKLDTETEEFLAKLNSPTKKRDSLLGYFPRKESPTAKKKDAPNNAKATKEKNSQSATVSSAKSKDGQKSHTPKSGTRVPRRSTRKSIELTAAVDIQTIYNSKQNSDAIEQNITQTNQTPSGRPKRLCAGKARYDYDLELSPTKLGSPKRVVSKGAKKCEIDYEDEVIQLDDSNMSFSPEKIQKKLAPVFVRAVPKPSPDPVALKARQDFLMSGVPEKMRLEMEKQKQYEQIYEEELDHFPRVCHIQQFSVNENTFLQNNLVFQVKLKPCEYILAFEEQNNASLPITAKVSTRRSRGNSTVGISKMKATTNVDKFSKTKMKEQRSQLSTIENKRTIIKSWKKEFERFPTFKCYNQMREKYRFFSALDSAQNMEQVSESLVVTRRTQRIRDMEVVGVDASGTEQDDATPPATAPNGELLFTEKYKPMLVDQVLVNLGPVTQLRDFLAVWANGSVGNSARNSQTIDDSFDASNDSNSSLCNTTGNAVVLLGPVSSGKTNAVYALANDMNFNVLEINAGMKRTGKRLIQELQEATQSHQIRKDSTPTQSASKAQKNLLRMSLNGKKLRKQNLENTIAAESNSGSGCGSFSVDVSQSIRKCLILIEDADVVFDQLDSGFTDAIYTLAASSKRPVIVMATNPNCSHLQRLMNQNTIYFTPPNALNISRFMAVLSLIENCPINLDDLVSLYLYNGKDLRRTLLELQFFIQSGGDRSRLAVDLKIKSEKASQQNLRTPEKCVNTKREIGFFASPTKESLTNEQGIQQQQEPDEQLGRERLNGDGDNKTNSNHNVYIHRSLFQFFTGNQNEKWRIPFPVDFGLLRVNLTEIFQSAQRLHQTQEIGSANEKSTNCTDNDEKSKSYTSKRRTRTPKKLLVNRSVNTTPSTDTISDGNYHHHNQQALTNHQSQLDVLCDFYDNISIAALLGTHNADMSEGNKNNVSGVSGILGGGADLCLDRLLPNLSEHIAHGIVEQAISINLEANACPYNLFNTPEERVSVCDYMNSYSLISSRSQRTRALDVEPTLRAICRSEKQRAMQERRSTRFYHYLRHSAANLSSFSTEPFDKACSIFQNNTTIDEESDNESLNKQIKTEKIIES